MHAPRLTVTFNYPCGCTRTRTITDKTSQDRIRAVLALAEDHMRWLDTNVGRPPPCETGEASAHPTKEPR